MDTYIFYRSFHEALSELDIKEYGKIMYAINEYALNQNEEKVNALSGITKALWTLIKPQIDANLRRREIGSRNAEYGKLGGRPRKEKTPMGLLEETPSGLSEKTPMGFSTETPNVNVNDNVNKNVKENLNKKDNVNVNGKTNTNTDTDTNTIPTLNDVREYIKNENLSVEAEKFYTYYQAREWQNVTNWRLALLKWNENQINFQKTEKKSSSSKKENDYCKDAKEVLAELKK